MLAAVLFTATAAAQEIKNFVVNSTGRSLQSPAGGIDFNIGEAVTGIITNGTNEITQGFLQPEPGNFYTINLKLYLEGFYRGGGMMQPTLYDLGISPDPTATDSITVNLWSPLNLSAQDPDYTVNGLLHDDGTVSLNFPASITGNSFYIAIKHRNSLETWSSLPMTFDPVTFYDFSSGYAQAYDDGVNFPLVNVETGVYALYSGDINQDGTVDATDMAIVDNDNASFAFGYNASDATGDGATDASDIAIIDNNQQLFLFYARPY